MSVILALETTSDVCAVALGTVESYVLESCNAPREHNKRILPMIDAACASLGIDRQAIACVAFSAGPGSFTGVRLGAAVAQGVATGTNAQIYGAPTSLCMGQKVFRITRRTGEFVVQRISRRDLVYEARLNHDGEHCRFVSTDRLVKQHEFDGSCQVFHDTLVPLCAFDVMALATRHELDWQSPAHALPIYVEGDHPWRPTS